MDHFPIVRLAGDALDRCRRRVQQAINGHRGRTGDPLNPCRRILHTGTKLLTDKQIDRLTALFTDDRAAGKKKMQQLITSLAAGVPAVLSELRTWADP